MSAGVQFWVTAAIVVGTAWTFYIIGYRTGWTDASAVARKWADK